MDGFALDLFAKIILQGKVQFALFFIEKAEFSTEHQLNRLEKDDVRPLHKQMYPLAVHEGQGSHVSPGLCALDSNNNQKIGPLKSIQASHFHKSHQRAHSLIETPNELPVLAHHRTTTYNPIQPHVQMKSRPFPQ